MNTIVEYEASQLESLLDDDPLGARMLLERFQVPVDVQDHILAEASRWPHCSRYRLLRAIERHGYSTLPDQISR